jgi:hypothetical protein
MTAISSDPGDDPIGVSLGQLFNNSDAGLEITLPADDSGYIQPWIYDVIVTVVYSAPLILLSPRASTLL